MAGSKEAAEQTIQRYLGSRFTPDEARRSPESLLGRKALITGAGRGIGREVALKFALYGADLLLNAKSSAGLDEVAGIAQELGVVVDTLSGDVSDPQTGLDLADRARTRFAGLDILVNNAGITRDNLALRMTTEQWQEVIGTNLNGAFFVTRPALRLLMKSSHGRVINSGSVSMLGNGAQINYSAAKAALVGFTGALASEVGKRGVTVNTVALGPVETAIWEEARGNLTKFQSAEDREAGKDPTASIKARMTVLGGKRFLYPSEAADWIHVLASDKGANITGQTILVDGGLTLLSIGEQG